MTDRLAPRPRQWSRPKSIIFAAVGLMTLYVLYHNERFLIQPETRFGGTTRPLLMVPLLLPSHSIRPYSAASDIARSLSES